MGRLTDDLDCPCGSARAGRLLVQASENVSGIIRFAGSKMGGFSAGKAGVLGYCECVGCEGSVPGSCTTCEASRLGCCSRASSPRRLNIDRDFRATLPHTCVAVICGLSYLKPFFWIFSSLFEDGDNHLLLHRDLQDSSRIVVAVTYTQQFCSLSHSAHICLGTYKHQLHGQASCKFGSAAVWAHMDGLGDVPDLLLPWQMGCLPETQSSCSGML